MTTEPVQSAFELVARQEADPSRPRHRLIFAAFDPLNPYKGFYRLVDQNF